MVLGFLTGKASKPEKSCALDVEGQHAVGTLAPFWVSAVFHQSEVQTGEQRKVVPSGCLFSRLDRSPSEVVPS